MTALIAVASGQKKNVNILEVQFFARAKTVRAIIVTKLQFWVGAMGELVQFRAKSQVPTAVDHLALRSLLRYMSLILKIPYKSISDNDSQIKNYANNKSIKDRKLQLLFKEYSQAAAEALVPHIQKLQSDEYGLFLAKYMFGEEWLGQNGVHVVDRSRPPALNDALMHWLEVEDTEAVQVEQRYRGLWRVMRASSAGRRQPPTPEAELKDINYSLLNIRPRDLSPGGLCEFRWYYRGRFSERDETRVFSGFAVPNIDRLEFFGRLQNRHRPLILMSWRFTPNAESIEHTEVANGISLSLNSDTAPVAAHIRAFFIPTSDQREGEAFDQLLDTERKRIGVHPKEALKNEIPPEDYERTIAYLSQHEPMVGFHPSQGHNPMHD